MEFTDIVAITGMQGLYKTVAKRNDGMIVSAFGEEKPRFVSSRIHMFTPLENITIYTNEDAVSLKEVFRSMKSKLSECEPPDPNSSSDDLRDYFEKVLPEFDKEKVYVSDIKKVVKWFNAIRESNLLTDDLLKEIEEESETEPVDGGKEEEVSEEDTTKTAAKKTTKNKVKEKTENAK